MVTVSEWTAAMQQSYIDGRCEPDGFARVYLNYADRYTQADIDRAINNHEYCDISPEFPGFAHVYADALYYLGMHPGIENVLDLGCGAGFQSYAFTALPSVKQYVGVDFDPNTVEGDSNAHFIMDDVWHYEQVMDDYDLNPDTTLVVMSYVPGTEPLRPSLAREFPHHIWYYPGID